MIKILKKPTGSVRFWFISLKPKKPNRTQTEKTGKKLSQTGKKRSQTEKPSQTCLNRFLSKKPNRSETNWFKLVLIFLKKINLIIFFYKN